MTYVVVIVVARVAIVKDADDVGTARGAMARPLTALTGSPTPGTTRARTRPMTCQTGNAKKKELSV